ncbi:universal stress protein [Streptomyces sp. NPDC059649]|uniref:universal stress protein n=1 Tax=Streptomyces sp. NPDC059649 TaxID=3346895 RepID=UPI0036A7E78D
MVNIDRLRDEEERLLAEALSGQQDGYITAELLTSSAVRARGTVGIGRLAGFLVVQPGGHLPRQETLRHALGTWREKYPSVEVTEQAVIGQPARHLLESGGQAELVVIGRQTRSPKAPPPRIGHVAHALLHHCPAPVAVVPHG